MNDINPVMPAAIGLDDGYAFTKIVLSDGRFIAIPSRACIGRTGITWLEKAEQRVFEYETDDTVYSVGAVDGTATYFDEYPWSGLNRSIVQHALKVAGLEGRSIHVVSGLPVSSFYLKNGEHRTDAIGKKCESLKLPTRPLGSGLPASVAFHEVIPEALAAWYDDVIVEEGDGITLDADRISTPVAIVDIGGRTTDYVVVKDQGIIHGSSGSFQCGMLTVKQLVADGLQTRFDSEVISEQRIDSAVQNGVIRFQGTDHSVCKLVSNAKREVVERILFETRRQLGLGNELDRVLFVGGGAVALADYISDWFPHQATASHPAFANARGMLKYLRYVCEASDAS
jgi:plasmid segregation protein ParM